MLMKELRCGEEVVGELPVEVPLDQAELLGALLGEATLEIGANYPSSVADPLV